MIEIPADNVTREDLAEWFNTKNELARLKSKEALLRTRIFRFFFPLPKEGTNKHELGDGTGAELKGTYVINRTVDPGSLEGLREAQKAEGTNLPKINLDELVKWKPEVNISAYRELTEEERLFFDQCLIIKPGSPQLEIAIPKKGAKA